MSAKAGFLFDLDGVIADTAHLHFFAWSKLAQSIGIALPPSFEERLKGVSRLDSLDQILAYGKKEALYQQGEKQAFADQKNAWYQTCLQTLGPKDMLPGVLPFLDESQKRGIPCAIASASFSAPLILKKLGILNRFSFIVDPKTLHKGKPDPEIFQKAAAGLGKSPKNCVGFEDSKAGIRSIKGAGAFAVGISQNALLKEADVQVPAFSCLTIDRILHSFPNLSL